MATSVAASWSGQWLRVVTDVSADGAPAARVELHARMVNRDGVAGLSAQIGAMPGHLPDRFVSDERLTDDPRSLIRAAVPPQLIEALAPAVPWRTPLLRSHADVADKWSFIEMAELLTQARERAYLDGSLAGVIRYTLVGPHSGAPCLSAWELLGKPATTRGEAAVAGAPSYSSALALR